MSVPAAAVVDLENRSWRFSLRGATRGSLPLPRFSMRSPPGRPTCEAFSFLLNLSSRKYHRVPEEYDGVQSCTWKVPLLLNGELPPRHARDSPAPLSDRVSPSPPEAHGSHPSTTFP